MTDGGAAAAPRVCFVLPKYAVDDSEHYAHVPALLEQVSHAVDLAVVVERGDRPPRLDGVRVEVLTQADAGRARRVWELFRVFRALSRSGYRSVFVRYSRTAVTVLLLARPLLRLRVHFWASGQGEHGTLSPKQRVNKGVQDLHFTWLARRVDRFVTGPETMLGYMSTRWGVRPDRMQLLYNDIDVERFTPVTAEERLVLRTAQKLPADAFVVLFVHRLSERRGSRLLVPVAQQLAARLGDRLRLVVIGTGADDALVREQVESAGLGEQVLLLGALPNASLPDHYRAADCLLMPSYEEGFPRVVLEGMAAAIPVVATRAGGTADLFDEGYRFLYDTGDVGGLVSGLAELAGNPTGAATAGAELRERACARYSTPVVARMFAGLFGT